jgi:hypothetical protein
MEDVNMTNEFETTNVEEDIPESFDSAQPADEEDMISRGPRGTAYNWKNAPEVTRAPPRIDLTGKVVTLKTADIILPPKESPWVWNRKKDKELKPCQFILTFDHEGQKEFLSGIRVFKRGEKYSDPTITRDRVNQASQLLGIYADFKKKNINEVSLREFLAYLNSQPKVVIKGVEFKNPTTGLTVKKNMVEKFL